MPALEPVDAIRVVAAPAALDAAAWTGDGVDVIRVAPDEALGLGATAIVVDDPDAIVEPDPGFVVALLDPDDLQRVTEHAEWQMPDQPGALSQGKVAGVPAKLVAGEPALLIVQSAYVDELRGRLRW